MILSCLRPNDYALTSLDSRVCPADSALFCGSVSKQCTHLYAVPLKVCATKGTLKCCDWISVDGTAAVAVTAPSWRAATPTGQLCRCPRRLRSTRPRRWSATSAARWWYAPPTSSSGTPPLSATTAARWSAVVVARRRGKTTGRRPACTTSPPASTRRPSTTALRPAAAAAGTVGPRARAIRTPRTTWRADVATARRRACGPSRRRRCTAAATRSRRRRERRSAALAARPCLTPLHRSRDFVCDPTRPDTGTESVHVEIERTNLCCSVAALDPRVGHTTDLLSPFISVLCHSD